MPEWLKLLIWATGTVAASFLAAYSSAYWRERGKNLATHDDIEKLVDQVRTITMTTKEIESKISGELWDRQKQWELKRDILFDAAKRLHEVDNKLMRLNTMYKMKAAGALPATSDSLENQYITEWDTAYRALEEIETLVQIACSTETMKAFAELDQLLRLSVSKVVGGDFSFFTETQKDRNAKLGMVRVAIRRELGMKFNVMPLAPRVSDLTARKEPET